MTDHVISAPPSGSPPNRSPLPVCWATVAGEQVTPGAPWRIRLTDDLRGMLVDDAPDSWVAVQYATRALGVSRQTVLQRVKRSELRAVLTRTGRRKGLRIELPNPPQRPVLDRSFVGWAVAL